MVMLRKQVAEDRRGVSGGDRILESDGERKGLK